MSNTRRGEIEMTLGLGDDCVLEGRHLDSLCGLQVRGKVSMPLCSDIVTSDVRCKGRNTGGPERYTIHSS